VFDFARVHSHCQQAMPLVASAVMVFDSAPLTFADIQA
jgi:hypothetical protein